MSETKIAKLLSILSELFPTLKPTPSMARAWEVVLGEYSEEKLMAAARKLGRVHAHGAPSVSHVVEAIEGKLIRRAVAARDCWDRVILQSSGGSPAISHYEVVRVDIETGSTLAKVCDESEQLAVEKTNPQLSLPEQTDTEDIS